MKRRVLITGSSGMLGVDLSHELHNDYEVYGIDAISCPLSSVHRFYRCDITDKGVVLGVISKVKPEVILHAAAWTDVDGCELDKRKARAINYGGTKNVASACRKAGALLIYIGTDFVFDGKKANPYKETDKTGPLNIYAKSKLMGEKAVGKMLRRYFILRTSWLYGRHGKNFVSVILKKAEFGKALKVVNDQIGSPTYTKDFAIAIHVLLDRFFTQYARLPAAGERNTGYGIYHISNSGSVSWYEYARAMLKLTGSKTEVVPISSKELARPARRPSMSVLDNSKFAEFTGYRMRNWKDALREYLTMKGG